MAVGPTKDEAARFTRKHAARVFDEAKALPGFFSGHLRLRSEAGAWCPHYEVVAHYREGGGRRTTITQVRLIRASNGEASVITDVADAS
jgi:hypothetical protein